MNGEIKEILAYFEEYVKINDMHDSEPMLNWKDLKIVLDYITNLQTIADNRMNTILKIEKYCIDEKEDLICGGEVCEDVLKIIDELKGK